MFSYHPRQQKAPKSDADCYWNGFIAVDVPIERMARGICTHVWSPNIYEGGRRLKKSWLSCDWLTLDFDDGELTLTDAVNRFCDMTHIIGTTASHQKIKKDKPACDRYRVVVKFEERITDLALYHHQLRVAEKKYSVDPSCKDGARLFFPCTEIISINPDGYEWEIDRDVAPEPDYTQITIKRASNHSVPTKWLVFLNERKFPENEYNTTCYKIGAGLGPLGYSAEEVCAMIYASPTYKDAKISADLREEILEAVSNGIKRGISDLAPPPAK